MWASAGVLRGVLRGEEVVVAAAASVVISVDL
jgi:hypothetical protein